MVEAADIVCQRRNEVAEIRVAEWRATPKAPLIGDETNRARAALARFIVIGPTKHCVDVKCS
jgi:hypothetical protein